MHMSEEAAFWQKLSQSNFLPSASAVASQPKRFARFCTDANVMKHRPIDRHEVPLPLMHEAFGHFVDLFNNGTPSHPDCSFAIALCQVALQVSKADR